MAEKNPRIVVPPEVSATGPTPPPSRRAVVPAGDGQLLPLSVILALAAALIGGFIFFLARDSETDINATAPEIEVLEDGTGEAANGLAGSTAPDVEAVPTTISETPVDSTTIPPTTAAAPSTEPTTTSQAPTTTSTTTVPEVVLAGPPLRDTGTVRHAVFSGGVVYLRGSVPSPEFGDQIVAAAEAVVGEGNVINQYVIDADAPAEDSAPLYVADTVLFLPSQSGINPQFFPILDLGSRLLTVNEDVKISVVAYTDSVGSEELNRALSQDRADTVQQYWLDQGFDPERISAVGMGESDPIGDNNTAQGRQANRRAEFIVIGILG
ncbi:MAG: OmpA family protein [Acidimicrobiales bacterium]|nr:OmpA family protein [Acidimicrobiales bacterium]